MKELTLKDKDAIREALTDYTRNYPSQNRAAESMKGVSAATISQVVNGKYQSISDDMFARIAQQIGYSMDRWAIVESQTWQRITFAMTDAQQWKNVSWVVGDAGCGKTTAAIEYRRTHRNVFYILCSEDMRKSDFVREIAKQVGAPTDGTNLRDILDYAISMISFLDRPLLIFDEGDKLTDSVFNYFISIYNRLEGKAGIIFLSTDYIKRRIDNGLRYNKKGYKEIHSRIGRKFFDVSVATEQDVYAICAANGLDDPGEVKRVLGEARMGEYDLRRVKRVVHACKRILETKKMKDEA